MPKWLDGLGETIGGWLSSLRDALAGASDSALFGVVLGVLLTLLSNFMFERWRNRQADRRDTLQQARDTSLEAIRVAWRYRESVIRVFVATKGAAEIRTKEVQKAKNDALDWYDAESRNLVEQIHVTSVLGSWDVWACLRGLYYASVERVPVALGGDEEMADETQKAMDWMIDRLAAVAREGAKTDKWVRSNYGRKRFEEAMESLAEFVGGKRGD